MLARPLWFTFGCAATGCGIVGAVLPVMPTTPFLLLSRPEGPVPSTDLS